MSGTLTLVPKSNSIQRGNWTTSSTAVTQTTAVNDGSDATYDRLSSNYTSYAQGASQWFQLAGQTLPPDARVVSAYARVRAARTGTSTRYIKIRLAESTLNPNHLTGVRPIGPDNTKTPALSVGSVIANYQAPPGTKLSDGKAIDQAAVNEMWLEVFFLSNTDTRIYDVAAVVNYDEKPTATVTGPVGTVTDSGTPTILWDYLDDLQPQAAYQVQILDAGNAVIYDSGQVKSSDTFHTVTSNIAAGTYTINLRVAQLWTGPGGDFWGDWVTGSLVMGVELPSTPLITATDLDALARADLAVTPNLNLFSYDMASNELGPFGGPANIYTLVGMTMAKASGNQRTGSWATALTMNASVPATTARALSYAPGIPISGYTPNVTKMAVSCYMKAGAGAVTNAWRVDLGFYDDPGTSLIANRVGTPVSVTTGGYVELKAEGVVPAGAARVRITIWDLSAPTAGNVYYLDDVYLHWGDGTTVPLSNRRGGLTYNSFNLLSYDDSTVENNVTNWMADNANTTVDISSTQALHGTLALRMTRTGSTGQVQARLKDYGPYFNVTPGQLYTAGYNIISPSAARTARIIVRFYDTNLTVVASATHTVTTSTSAWTANYIDSPPPAVPSNPAIIKASMFIEIDNVAAGELHYVDTLWFSYPVGSGGPWWDTGEQRKVEGPYTTVQYSEDSGTTWNELFTQQVDGNTQVINYSDYEVPHTSNPTLRTYRAFNWITVNDKILQSAYSTVSTGVGLTLTNAWIHADDNPSGTAVSLSYDGTGRSDAPDNLEVSNTFAGRAYPQSQFGENVKRSITVSAQLPDSASQQALLALATRKSTVVFRDKRGRRVRGVLKNVTFTDDSWGQDVTFTVELRGEQWS